jgi:CBS-domain-containing membrane protein
MDATTLASRINASNDDAVRKATLKAICKELTLLIDRHPATNTPNEVLDVNEMSDKEKALRQMSDSELIRLALPRMCTHVMSGKMTVANFATLVADTYNNLRLMCIMDGIDI